MYICVIHEQQWKFVSTQMITQEQIYIQLQKEAENVVWNGFGEGDLCKLLSFRTIFTWDQIENTAKDKKNVLSYILPIL